MNTDIFEGVSNEVILKIAILVIVILFSIKLIRMIGKSIDAKVNPQERPRLKGLLKILRILIIVVVALTCMSTLGINTANILAVLAATLMALVVALRDYLANMAGGVMIMVLKTFVIGDYIVTPYGEGNVINIYLARTDLITIDMKTISIPNGALANAAVTNTTVNPVRRMDIEVSVAYGTDIAYAKKVLEDIFRSDPEILKDKDVFAHAMEFQDSGILMRAEGYVANSRYWDIRWRMIEAVAMGLPAAGIEIPYNKVDIYMKPDGSKEVKRPREPEEKTGI